MLRIVSTTGQARVASVACALVLFVVNPALMMQGCFLRCPSDPRQAEVAPRLEQTYRVVHESGILELEIDDVWMKASASPQRDAPWVRTAGAMPSCPRITDQTRYSLRATLTATWRPHEGDEVVIADEIPLHADTNVDVAPHWLTLGNRWVEDQGPTSQASWDLAFKATAGRFALSRVQVGGKNTDWAIRADGETIERLQVGTAQR